IACRTWYARDCCRVSTPIPRGGRTFTIPPRGGCPAGPGGSCRRADGGLSFLGILSSGGGGGKLSERRDPSSSPEALGGFSPVGLPGVRRSHSALGQRPPPVLPGAEGTVSGVPDP